MVQIGHFIPFMLKVRLQIVFWILRRTNTVKEKTSGSNTCIISDVKRNLSRTTEAS